MYIVLFLEILGAVLAAFGMVCLWHFVTDGHRSSLDMLDAVVYDGSFEQEELGGLVRCAESRELCEQRQKAVLVKSGASLSDEVARVLEENGILIYHITDQ